MKRNYREYDLILERVHTNASVSIFLHLHMYKSEKDQGSDKIKYHPTKEEEETPPNKNNKMAETHQRSALASQTEVLVPLLTTFKHGYNQSRTTYNTYYKFA